MSNVVNLNQFRKTKARKEKKQRSEENVAKYGRTKAERQAEADASERATRLLEDHRRETDESAEE
ncbi:DUF4169 family protein [Heliomarina baculiformis]|uniref:DUF4169 family protein n=1 Tax=Heliomarina baculiformis TaxID=2872036 RepID=UPI001EE1DB3B|nr:DUF4169 family protein [Heliomarina baculiformis]